MKNSGTKLRSSHPGMFAVEHPSQAKMSKRKVGRPWLKNIHATCKDPSCVGES